jgi:hypothetical protein
MAGEALPYSIVLALTADGLDDRFHLALPRPVDVGAVRVEIDGHDYRLTPVDAPAESPPPRSDFDLVSYVQGSTDALDAIQRRVDALGAR